MEKTKAQISIPKLVDYQLPERMIKLKGTKEQIEFAKNEIIAFAHTASLASYGGRPPPGYGDQAHMLGMPLPMPPYCTSLFYIQIP